MTENTTPVEEQTSSSVQAGDLTAKLQACRESAGLDIEQAADEMHLSANLLRALEKEDFAHLPEPPYVRGYLRGYAKLADQDARDLIRTYEALRGADPDEIAHHFAPARPLGKVTQPSISPSIVKFIALAVVVLGLGLLSMIPGVRGWFSDTWSNFSAQTAPPQVTRPAPAIDTFTARKDAEEQAEQKQTQTESASVSTETATESEDSQQTGSSATQTTTDKTESGAEAQTETTDTSTASTETDSATQQQDASLADSTQTSTGDTTIATTETGTTENTSTAVTDTTAATTENATTETDAATTTPQPIAGEVNVKLEFSEEVWMQVKDDDKKTLFEALNSAGSTKEFKATTPLNFKVGNASGVKIYLNGQEYDQAPYVKGSVARFKVE